VRAARLRVPQLRTLPRADAAREGLQLGPSDAAKAWIDRIFLADMLSVCGLEPTCTTPARMYYEAVRLKSGPAFYGQ
jgi:hypothetical protein